MRRERPGGHFGIDAPWVPWMWVGFSVLYIVLAICGVALWDTPVVVTVIVLVLAACFAAGAALYWYASLRGKYAVWIELIAKVPRPRRRALDMGCGRGGITILVAEWFPQVEVEGIDLWRGIDQSGNSPESAMANARENGVAERIRLTTADMTDVPFDDASFDLVTASLSIHNIHSREGRAKAVDEAWRVLEPGGRLIIVDISKTREYERRLVELGATELVSRDAGWRMWWSGPWMPTRILTAIKAMPA